jgi:hypothetical protein
MPETMPQPMGETVPEAMAKTMVEMIKSLHDNDRRREAKEPGRPGPIGKEIGTEVVGRVRIRRGNRWRDLVNLRRQPRRVLGDPPAPVGLRACLDGRLLLLPADDHRDGVAAA